MADAVLREVQLDIQRFLDGPAPEGAAEAGHELHAARTEVARLERANHKLRAALSRAEESDSSTALSLKRARTDWGPRSDEGEERALRSQLEAERLQGDQRVLAEQAKYNALDGEVSKLRRQVAFLTSEEQRTSEELRAREAEYLSSRHGLEAQLQKSQADARALQQRLRAAEALSGDHERRANHVEGNARGELEVREAQVEQLQAQVTAAQAQAARHRAECERLRAAAAEAGAAAVAPRPLSSEADADAERLSGAAARELRDKQRQLERDCRRLREQLTATEARAHNSERLRQQLEDVEARAERQEAQLSALQRASVERDSLQDEKKQWAPHFSRLLNDAVVHGLVAPSDASAVTPMRVLHLVQALQQERAVLLEQQGQSRLTAAQLQGALEEACGRADAAGNALSLAQGQAAEREQALSDAKRRNEFLGQERASLQALLSSYDQEARLHVSANADEQREARIRELEADFARSQARCDELDAALAQRAAPQALQEARARVETLERELEAAKRAAPLPSSSASASASASASLGVPASPQLRVLHLIKNPVSQANVSELEALRAEVASLRRRLVEPATANDDEPVAAAGASEDVQSLKMRHQRLKELFREKIKSFREAVYLLTGFKIDMVQAEHPQFRLRSMFAENESDELRFQWTNGGLELLKTDYADKIDSRIFAYLTTCNSVPAFLSNVTLDLFERQTFFG